MLVTADSCERQASRLFSRSSREIWSRVTATIGGKPATVYYAGGVPLVTSGEFQIYVQVPEGLGAGNQEVIVRFGNYASPGGVTVAIR